VWDPRGDRKDQRCWYAYDYGVGPMVEWRVAEQSFCLACSTSLRYVLDLCAAGNQDDFGAGAVDITSYFKTAWWDVGLPGVKKRFRRPAFVLDADEDHSVTVRTRTDWHGGRERSSVVSIDVPDDGMIWGTGQWGTGLWGVSIAGEQQVKRGAAAGRAYAVQFEFGGMPNTDWGLNAVQLPYIVQRIR